MSFKATAVLCVLAFWIVVILYAVLTGYDRYPSKENER